MKPEMPQAGSVQRPGSATCGWIISPPGWPYRECGRPATQLDPEIREGLCDSHAEDYAEIFGWESLRSIAVESPNSEVSDSGRPTNSATGECVRNQRVR